jgi:hypothetical protein
MVTTTYRVTLSFATFHFRSDLANPAASITVCHSDERGAHLDADNYVGTQFQTGDVRHSPVEAAIALVRDCGRDWYLDPSESEPEDIDSHIRGLIRSVTPIA